MRGGFGCSKTVRNVLHAAFLLLAATFTGGCGHTGQLGVHDSSLAASRTEQRIDFLESRVAADPDDSVAWNQLASLYLERLRQTGDHDFIPKAEGAAERSLEIVPRIVNPQALLLLGRARAAGHRFADSRELARELRSVRPEDAEAVALEGDSHLELGDYEAAATTYAELEKLAPRTVATESRLARLAWIRGDRAEARRRLENALTAALESRALPEIAWVRWQLGEQEFHAGRYREAEARYRSALAIYPDHLPSLAAMGRARAARGDIAGAIEWYRKAVEIDPVPSFVAYLSNLYRIAGREREAEELFDSIETTDRLDDRHVVMLLADAGVRLEEAYTRAWEDYENRPDVYAANALAWAAFRSGRLEEAERYAAEALRLGTPEARFYYHAGMIAVARGEREKGRQLLQQALTMSPLFDPVQAETARQTIAELDIN